MAVTAIVDTVARRLTRAKLSEVEDRARRYILRHFADAGRAPGIAELQRELRLASHEDAAAILITLHTADLILYDAALARITAAYPFSSEPTAHQVRFGHHTVHALCAIDALGIPFMLGTPAIVRSQCFWCHAAVEVHVEDGEISKHQPANLVAWYPEKKAGGCVATTRCILINFFCSPEDLAAWRAANPGEQGTVLSLREALQAGQIIFGEMLR